MSTGLLNSGPYKTYSYFFAIICDNSCEIKSVTTCDYFIVISSVQFSSVAQSCPTLPNYTKVYLLIRTVVVQSFSCVRLFATPFTAACQESPNHVHWVGDAIQYLILCCPLFLLPSIFLDIRVFSNESVFPYLVVTVIELQLQHQPFQWIFRVDFPELVLSPCCGRDTPKFSPAPLFKIINSSVLSFPYGPTATSIYGYWKTNHSFDYMDLYWQSDVSALRNSRHRIVNRYQVYQFFSSSSFYFLLY